MRLTNPPVDRAVSLSPRWRRIARVSQKKRWGLRAYSLGGMTRSLSKGEPESLYRELAPIAPARRVNRKQLTLRKRTFIFVTVAVAALALAGSTSGCSSTASAPLVASDGGDASTTTDASVASMYSDVGAECSSALTCCSHRCETVLGGGCSGTGGPNVGHCK